MTGTTGMSKPAKRRSRTSERKTRLGSSRNPLPCRLRVEQLESRLAAFVAAGLDEERIRKWTVIRGAYLQPQEAEALLALV